MSYRPDEQALTKHIDQILEGFQGFQDAVHKRIESDDWKDTHLVLLKRAEHKIVDLRELLAFIRKDTW